MIVFSSQQTYAVELLPGEEIILPANKRMVLSDLHAGAMKNSGLFEGQYQGLGSSWKAYCGEDLNGKRFLVSLMGGLGDIITGMPCLYALCEHFPEANIVVMARPAARKLVTMSGWRGDFINYPIEFDVADAFDYVFLDKTPCRYEGFNVMGNTALYARLLCLPEVPPRLLISVQGELPPSAVRPAIGIHVNASHEIKSYPVNMTCRLIDLLLERNYSVHLFGDPIDELPQSDGQLFNACGAINDYELLGAYVHALDCMVCPDSFLLHFASALSVPCVALLGLFPPELRTERYPDCISLIGEAACVPCCQEIRSCPNNKKICRSFLDDRLSPEAIVRTVENHLQ